MSWPRPGGARRTLKLVAIALGASAVLFVGATVGAYLLVDVERAVNEQIAKAKPKLEQKLGRSIQVGPVSTRLFPLGGRVEAVSIAADRSHPEDDRPLLALSSVGFDISVLDALLSGGRRIVVKSVRVDGLELSLVRYKDGRLSYQDILDRLRPSRSEEPAAPAAAAPSSGEPARPPPSSSLDLLRAISIEELRLADAEVRLIDHDTTTGKPTESFIRQLDVRLGDVRVTSPISIRISAAIFGDAPNFELETSVGPFPSDLRLTGAPKIGKVRLRLTDVDLSRIAPYLGTVVPARVDSALVSMSCDVAEPSADKPFAVSGFLAVKDLQLSGGRPFDARVDLKLTVEPAAMGARIEQLEVKVGSVELSVSGALTDLAKTPRFEGFTIHSSTLSPSELLGYYPPARKDLPKGLKLDGLAALDLKASGDAAHQTVNATADLGGLDIFYPGKLIKPPGTPLELRVDGDFTATDADLRQLALKLDELELVVAGTVKDFSKPTVDLTAAAKPFSFDHLARLLPSANRALTAAQARASGEGKLTAFVKGSAENLDAGLELGLIGVKLDVPGTRLDGDLTVKIAAQGNPQRALHATARLDANRAVIEVQDRLKKAASTPLLLDLELESSEHRLALRRFELTLAELRLTAAGWFDLAGGVSDVKLDMPRLDLEKFAQTVTAIPPGLAKKGFVNAKLALRGNPSRLETMELSIDPLEARLGRSDLRGEVKLRNPARPLVRLRLASTLLDLDALMPRPAGNPPARVPEVVPDAKPPTERADDEPAEDDPSLRDYDFTGALDFKEIVYAKDEIRDFKGEVRLVDGVLKLERCSLAMYGGTFDAKGTEATIWKRRMPFKASFVARGVEMNQALSSRTKFKNALFGKADLDAKLAGEGFATHELEEKLAGEVSVTMPEAKLSGAALTDSVLGRLGSLEKKLLGKLNGLRSDNTFHDLKADFDVRDGRFNLREPITATVDGNKTELGGAIGISGELFLKGQYYLAPEHLMKATGGRCKPSGPTAIPVDIGGTLSKPEIRPDVRGIAGSLVAQCLGGAGSMLQELLGKDGDKSDAAKNQLKKKARELLKGVTR